MHWPLSQELTNRVRATGAVLTFPWLLGRGPHWEGYGLQLFSTFCTRSQRPVFSFRQLWHKTPSSRSRWPVHCSLAPLHPTTLCSKSSPCDEVRVAGGNGGALHGGAQLQRHEGGHLAGPAHQLQVLDCNLGFEYYLRRSALLCTQWSQQYSYFMRSNHFIMGSGDQ